MHDLQRLHFVTQRYEHLQGLRLIPLALPFLVSAAWQSGQLSWLPIQGEHAPGYWFVGLVGIAVTISTIVGHWYGRRFGTVQQRPTPRGQALLVLFFVIFGAALWAQNAFTLPVSLPIATVGVALAFIGVAGGQRRMHYIAVAAICLLFANTRSFGVPLRAPEVVLQGLIGISLVVIGIGDHVWLRRTLAPVSHGQTI